METQPQRQNVKLQPPAAYFASYMVNRFHLARNSGFTLAHFGLLDDSGIVLDRIGVVLTDEVLNILRENLVFYSSQVGTAKKNSPSWVPKIVGLNEDGNRSFTPAGIVDFVHLTNWEDKYAEICFWNYSKAGLTDHLAFDSEKPYPTWGLALLRCDIDLQREFLEALYPS